MASLERERSGAPQLGQSEIAAAREMEGEDRAAMIRGMVDGLAQRLEQDGDDLQGWLRLARARLVLGLVYRDLGDMQRAEQNSLAPAALGSAPKYVIVRASP